MNTPETNPAAPSIHIGTSGYSFKDWLGTFYPPGLSSDAMLPFYAEHFTTVEVNFTYYRMPTPRTCAGMAEKTPDPFLFFVKAFQDFTHKHDLENTKAFLEGIAPMREAGKLAGILFQFPQAFKNSQDNREYLARLADAFAGHLSAVEFRDNSWAVPPVMTFLEDKGLSIVAVDEPRISTLFPPDAVVTGDLGYVRFHSRDGKNWYKGMEKRYDYFYTEEQLREWMPKLKTIARRARNVFVYFNNCHGGQAAENARAMQRLVKEAGLADNPPGS